MPVELSLNYGFLGHATTFSLTSYSTLVRCVSINR